LRQPVEADDLAHVDRTGFVVPSLEDRRDVLGDLVGRAGTPGAAAAALRWPFLGRFVRRTTLGGWPGGLRLIVLHFHSRPRPTYPSPACPRCTPSRRRYSSPAH